MAPKFVKVASDHPGVEFREVLFEDNKKLCKSLGVKVLPYMEIHAGARGRIDGFSCGPSKISLLRTRLEDASAAHCGPGTSTEECPVEVEVSTPYVPGYRALG